MAHITSNGNQIVISAILTKAGRQKLAAGVDAFNITKFAVADDLIDYSILGLLGDLQDNPETYPMLLPVLNGNLLMKSKLYTDYNINAGAKILAQISVDGLTNVNTNTIIAGAGTVTYTPQTIGSGELLYNITIDLTQGMPFSGISYRTSSTGQLIPVNYSTSQTIYSLSNVYSIVFTKKNITADVILSMNVAGMTTGANTTYTIKAIPSSNYTSNTYTLTGV